MVGVAEMTTYYQPKPEGWELLRYIGEYAARMYEAKVTVRIETQDGAVVEQQFNRIVPLHDDAIGG